MNKRSNLVRTVTIAGTSALLVASGLADGTKVELSAVPAPVKATIDQQTAQGATVGEIELETEDGKQVYSVDLKKDGKDVELEIGIDGKVIAEDHEEKEKGEEGEKDEADEQPIDAAQVPAAVKSAIEGHASGATIDKYTKESEDGAVAYEAEFKTGGQKTSVKVAEDGALLEVEKPAASVPAAVTDAIKKKYPAATVKKSEAVEVHFFEVKLDDGGKGREVKVDASGHIMGSEEEDED